jgi:hypothetical protein
MLKNILTATTHSNTGNFDIPNLIKFNVNAQFILIKPNAILEPKLIGQYETNKLAMLAMKENESKKYIDEDDYNYAIINLENMTPYFWKIKNKIINAVGKNPGVYY